MRIRVLFIIFYSGALLAALLFRFEYWPVTDYRFYARPYAPEQIEFYAFSRGEARIAAAYWVRASRAATSVLRAENHGLDKRAFRARAEAECRREWPDCTLRLWKVKQEGGAYVFHAEDR